jgi:hypothetical protein
VRARVYSHVMNDCGFRGPGSLSNMVYGRLNVVKDLKRTNQIVNFGRS